MNNFLENRRGYISWIDTVKGCGVYLVILGHLWYKTNLPIVNKAIYSFHMPMFFIITGFIIRSSSREPIAEYTKKQIARLLFPSIIFMVLSLPVYFLKTNDFDAISVVRRILFWDGLLPYNDPLWFFFVLFEVKVIERIFNIAGKKRITQFAFCLGSFTIGYFVYQYDIFLPFGLNRSLVALGFIIFGMITKGKFIVNKQSKSVKMLGSIVILFLWIVSGVWLNSKVSMYGFGLGHYWLFILSGICGSILFIWICQAIDKKVTYFRKIGENTVFIICTHCFCVSVFNNIAAILSPDYIWIYSILAIIFTVVLVMCYIPVCRFVNKYFPILNGRRLQ